MSLTGFMQNSLVALAVPAANPGWFQTSPTVRSMPTQVRCLCVVVAHGTLPACRVTVAVDTSKYCICNAWLASRCSVPCCRGGVVGLAPTPFVQMLAAGGQVDPAFDVSSVDQSQTGTSTTLTFTRSLYHPTFPISMTGATQIAWAIGSSNTLVEHAYQGVRRRPWLALQLLSPVG